MENFDKYIKGVMGTLTSIKREPTAGKPGELGVPSSQKQKADTNVSTKTEKNADAEAHKTPEKPDLKNMPGATSGPTQSTSLKPGQLVDTNTVPKQEKGAESAGAPGKAKTAGDMKAKTALKPGQMVAKPGKIVEKKK